MKPNSLNQSFFHPLDDAYVGSDAPFGESRLVIEDSAIDLDRQV